MLFVDLGFERVETVGLQVGMDVVFIVLPSCLFGIEDNELLDFFVYFFRLAFDLSQIMHS